MSGIVGSMLGQRRRRLPNIDPAMSQRLVFAGFAFDVKTNIY